MTTMTADRSWENTVDRETRLSLVASNGEPFVRGMDYLEPAFLPSELEVPRVVGYQSWISLDGDEATSYAEEVDVHPNGVAVTERQIQYEDGSVEVFVQVWDPGTWGVKYCPAKVFGSWLGVQVVARPDHEAPEYQLVPFDLD